jgi:hypothetical protein
LGKIVGKVRGIFSREAEWRDFRPRGGAQRRKADLTARRGGVLTRGGKGGTIGVIPQGYAKKIERKPRNRETFFPFPPSE